MSTLEDLFLIKLALEQGIVNHKSLETPLKALTKKRYEGKHATLGEVLMQQGVLSPQQLKKLEEQTNQQITQIHNQLSPLQINLDLCQKKHEVGKSLLGISYFASHPEQEEGILKSLSGTIAKNPRFLRRFFQLLERIQGSQNAFCAQVYDVSFPKLTIYREFVPGKSLAEHLDEFGTIPLQKACEYILEAAKGLDFIAEMGITHKNLKPSNLIIDPNKGLKVVDFSLPPTVAHYLAPEQYQRKKTDLRSDIFTLGMIFYETIHGEPFLAYNNIQDLKAAHEKGDYPNLSKLQELPSKTSAILRKMLSFSLQERYQAYSDLIKDLSEALIEIEEREQQGETPDKPSPETLEPGSESTEKPAPKLKKASSNIFASRKKKFKPKLSAEENLEAIKMPARPLSLGDEDIDLEKIAREIQGAEPPKVTEQKEKENLEHSSDFALEAEEAREEEEISPQSVASLEAIASDEFSDDLAATVSENEFDEDFSAPEEAMEAVAVEEEEEDEYQEEDNDFESATPPPLPEEEDFEIDFNDSEEEVEEASLEEKAPKKEEKKERIKPYFARFQTDEKKEDEAQE